MKIMKNGIFANLKLFFRLSQISPARCSGYGVAYPEHRLSSFSERLHLNMVQ
jgi:hypothetical protein